MAVVGVSAEDVRCFVLEQCDKRLVPRVWNSNPRTSRSMRNFR